MRLNDRTFTATHASLIGSDLLLAHDEPYALSHARLVLHPAKLSDQDAAETFDGAPPREPTPPPPPKKRGRPKGSLTRKKISEPTSAVPQEEGEESATATPRGRGRGRGRGNTSRGRRGKARPKAVSLLPIPGLGETDAPRGEGDGEGDATVSLQGLTGAQHEQEGQPEGETNASAATADNIEDLGDVDMGGPSGEAEQQQQHRQQG